ncbi:2-oxo acid dehydrogenase subunit E2 [Clostridium estertheticum]|uniref:2-oxo acid dehydrogenase subunit E2 n=1 Tax=Clostridium estertheticum TaxID=238834 RepID=UPI001C0C7AD5|nr:2-oxo acid dehydrogenase subunit E2 [Clostridium estertheticum]MBU3177004.1 2-oxo acid dehydrogenase subunit E2 [Clostridium estertheticum]
MELKTNKSIHSERFDLQRRAVSHVTTTSWHDIPHISYIYEPDITDFYKEFKILLNNKINLKNKISFNTIMLKVITEGLLKSPDLNSYVKYNHKKTEGMTQIFDEINISVPWLLPDGKMITPTIPRVEEMSLNDISEYISDLTKKIGNTNVNEVFYRAVVADTIHELKRFNLSVIRRILASKISRYRINGLCGKEKEDYYKIPENERLTEKDIRAGTVTVSNIGSLYKNQKGFFGLLEIIPPQAFAIGIGSIQEKPGVYLNPNGNKEIGIRKILPICLAFDHRAVDFNSLVPFLKRLDEIFANPSVIHKW